MHDSQLPLTETELVALRQIIKDAEHATYLRKMVFVFVPVGFAIVSGIAAALSWIKNNITWKT
jgi:putative effector of murein hydrolase LrgA (UPF0299 family)